MKLYNTLTRRVEEFAPHEENKVNMYTCGPTVYHYAHIGNLRSYIMEDVLQRSLEYLGYKVKRVMNITDVGHLSSDSDTGEDKMLKGAKRERKTVLEIADMYTKAFFDDFSKLNMKKPDVIARATMHIDDYIKTIEVLLEKGYAYYSNGNIYFDITKLDDYYALTNHKEDEMVVGVREGVEEDFGKKNQGDFVLWFTKSKFDDQELKWDSPWGVGYPGWHIECSCISMKYLGEYLDIHCGGVDNIFPHHTNEIAQSEAYLGHKWCSYWFHVEHLMTGKSKMSKSSGDFLSLSFIESKGYTPLAYRYFCLGSHYRKQLEFSFESLDGASQAYKKLKNKVLALKHDGNLLQENMKYYQDSFKEAVENDMNTSMMFTVLYDVLKDDNLNDFTKLTLVNEFDKVLGLNLTSVEEIEVDSEILKKIELRNQAKKDKNFILADQIRDELLQDGIRLVDSREGTKFERI